MPCFTVSTGGRARQTNTKRDTPLADMGLRRNIRNAFDTIIADICGSETYLPENKKPYTKKIRRTLTLQRARHPEERKTDGKLFIEKDCPSCGANFIPDEKHCCSFCGYSLDADNAKWVMLTTDK